MYISKVTLVNYRNFKNASFAFNKGINTIIGENGAGKTNLFRAIRLLLDDNLLRFAYRLDEGDFNRNLNDWRGHWIIISLEFSEISQDEAIQALFVHGTGNATNGNITEATYNLFFRPKIDIRLQLSQLQENDTIGLQAILEPLTILDYETVLTGKSTVDFTDPAVYNSLVGDFENVIFSDEIDESLYGIKTPRQLSLANEISFTFIKALRDVVSDFHSNKTNPLLNLLRSRSDEIDPVDFLPISENIRELNGQIEDLPDVKEIRRDILSTIKETVGETYAPSSLSIESNLSDEADKLLQSLKLYIGEDDGDYKGAIHELSLGGANLIFLTLKLLEYKYQRNRDTFANFLLIEEPEAHIHTHIQKTLFDNLEYSDTQIIYSTHSTHISEVSRISNLNILAKKQNFAEVYQPSNGLSQDEIIKLERYLDAIRSNLLFAKGVMLVEGDAEAILIPNLIKKVLGVSLDEFGISLINIGSTGFENVAQIFHDERVRRRCSIVTDLDSAIADTTSNADDDEKTKKYKEKMKRSEESGENRRVILNAFSANNNWINIYYATHTFEVDFIMAGNTDDGKELCEEVYTDPTTKTAAIVDIESGDKSRYGKRILTMANNEGKGWLAILLSNKISFKTKIPQYILQALLALNPISSRNLQVAIVKYRVKEHHENNPALIFTMVNEKLKNYQNETCELIEVIDALRDVVPDDQIISILEHL